MPRNDVLYDLALDDALQHIQASKAKRVLLQFADGLKPQADEVQRFLQEKTDATILIWGGSCFGSCDIPLEVKNLGVDLILQWGHSLS